MEHLLRVRRISPDDATSYYTLRSRSLEQLTCAGEPEVLRELGTGHGKIANVLRDYDIEGTQVWGVFNTQTLIGAIGLSRRFPLQKLEIAHVWGVFVMPRYRGTAVSRLLMEAVVDWCEHDPVVQWIATRFSRSSVHARQYFERFGFEVSDPSGSASERCDPDLLHMRRRV